MHMSDLAARDAPPTGTEKATRITMQITITGRNTDTGESIRSHVTEKLETVLEKYLDRAVDANVTFHRVRSGFECDCSAHLGTGLTAKSRGEGPDVYLAFDESCEKLEKQLRRHKRKLRDHHKRRASPVPAMEAPAYVLAPHEEADEDDASDATGEEHPPVIVAETTYPIRSLSVSEAVMQLELAHAEWLPFHNESHGGLNIVFRRDDGNIGWIDPKVFDKSA